VITVGGFNTSVDKTLELDLLRPGEVHRVRRVQSWPGGKGLHVALTVAALGEPVRLVGLIDAAHRSEFEDALGARGVVFAGVETKGALRTCLAVRDQGGARITEILEPGPELDPATRDELRSRFLTLARDSALAVLSGSTPPGFHEGAYGELVASLREADVRCLVDASGERLRLAVEARPFLVKPNREEAEALSGQAIDGPPAAARVARVLAARGVGMPVVSLGAAGAVAAFEGRAAHAWVSVPGAAHPVGSGDCLLGGLAVGLVRGDGIEEVLRLGVACGAANTLRAETGWVRREDVDALRPQVAMAWIDP
jgi:tagatose 6-phosphate kinase